MGFSLEDDIASMQPGEKRGYGYGSPDMPTHWVHYEDEQAMGDNGLPARGFRVGYFHVTNAEGHTRTFRHTPHGPGLTEAKPYAARLAANHVMDLIKRDSDRDDRLFNDRRR